MKKWIVILVAIMAVTTGTFAQGSNSPTIAIAPVAMNVLYIGVDNPLHIAISGVPADKVSATINQGTLTKISEGAYIARPARPGEATIKVFAEIDGQGIEGTMDFRVKLIPVPVATVGGRTGGNIVKNDLLSQRGIVADLGDFLFDVRFVVTQFDVSVSTSEGSRTESSNSQTFTDAQKALINDLKLGERVFFTNIKVRGPDSGVKDLRDVVFTIN